MTTPAQDAPLVFPSVAFRPLNLSVICIVLAAAATGLAWYCGNPLFGVFFGGGLALGLANALLVRRSVQNITTKANPQKSQMALNSASRLLVISVVGLGIAYLFRPLGLGVLAGLAVFEVLLVVTTTLPVVRTLRRSAAAGVSEADEASEGTTK
ncbi:ATP synthase subunit I [Mycolicibacter minnesotensis]